jgi:hypothetical protein
MKPPSGINIAKTGRADGTPWVISAADSGDGRYRMTVLIAGSPATFQTGRFYVPGPDGRPLRLGWASDPIGKLPFVAGAVAIKPCCRLQFADLTVRLSNGAVTTTRATVPPYSLTHAPGIAFFFVPTPRGVRPTAITARNAAGRVIAAWNGKPGRS